MSQKPVNKNATKYVDVISVDVYPEEYKATDYAGEYDELIRNTSDKKVAALAEVGYLPDIDLLENHTCPGHIL